MDHERATQDLNDLMEVSQAVSECVNNELYLDQILPDNVNDTTVLNLCYQLVLEELRELGIVFHVDTGDLTTNYHYAKGIYYLRKWFDADWLNALFKENEVIRLKVAAILDSPEESETSLIVAIIDVFDGYIQGNPEVAGLIETQLKIVSNELFEQHMDAVLAMDTFATMNSTTVFPELTENMDQVLTFLDYSKRHRAKVEKGLGMCREVEPLLDAEIFKGKMAIHDFDKISAKSLSMYSLTFDIENLDSYSPQFKVIADVIDKQHHSNNKHHIEYWIDHPDEVPIPEDIAELMADAFSKSQDIDKYTERYNHILTSYQKWADKDKSLFTRLFNKLKQHLTPNDVEGYDTFGPAHEALSVINEDD